MAGRAGAGAAAFGDNLRHGIADRRFHDRRAFLRLDLSRSPMRIDVGDLDHALRALRGWGADTRRPSFKASDALWREAREAVFYSARSRSPMAPQASSTALLKAVSAGFRSGLPSRAWTS